MKTPTVLSLALAGLLLLAAPAAAQGTDAAPETEEEAIRAAVAHYLQGHATGDGAHHAMVFHPVSNLYFIRDGALQTVTSADYIARQKGQAAADEAERKRRIAMVDVTGDAAVVKVELDYPGAFITDYFAMLKIDGEWKIVNKIFHVERDE